jgi:ribonucleoside-diphosphate reductase alpha chain
MTIITKRNAPVAGRSKSVPRKYDDLELPLQFDDRKKPADREISLSSNALTVLKARYLKKNLKGEVVETPREMLRRVAATVAAAELRYGDRQRMEQLEEEFFNLMADLDFLPNSPTLMNAGLSEGQLSACFVIPVGDSMPEIFEAVKHAALIQKSGGGVGYSFSRLRPAGDRVKTTKGVSSGPISFMKVFNEATETVKQGGRRRGANMGVLRVDHPDVQEFVNAKREEGSFTNFNISVGITGAFMKALADGGPYRLYNPRSRKEESTLDAPTVWRDIVKNAWASGDPGILFLDRINQDNPTPSLGDIESTNPCGEACLLPYEACNLGSINVSRFISNGAIDFGRLKKVIHLSVRFLDDVIDVNDYVPQIPQIRQQTIGNRKIGLGIMGFADLLIEMGIPYHEPRAAKVAENITAFIQKEAREASKTLAAERGPFPNWDKSIYHPHAPIRNASVTSIAPTGTLSIIAGCSPGIEPLFGVSFHRNILDGSRLLEVNPLFEKIAQSEGFYSQSLMEDLAQRGTVQDIESIPPHVRSLFITAVDVPPHKHVEMQAAFQKYTDMSVSKTINLPGHATPEDVENVFLLAYSLGCKGITVFRHGCRSRQVIDVGTSKKSASQKKRAKDTANLPVPDPDPPAREIPPPIPTTADEIPCPECGKGTIVLGACSVCRLCGYSRCG